MFKLNNQAEYTGTSLRGYINTSYKDLVRVFGEPLESDGYKVSGEWVFQDDAGNIITLYDWKATNLYDEDYPSLETFRSQPESEFHIGGKPGIDVDKFCLWLLNQLT